MKEFASVHLQTILSVKGSELFESQTTIKNKFVPLVKFIALRIADIHYLLHNFVVHFMYFKMIVGDFGCVCEIKWTAQQV